jgi:hypothetical protein
MLQSVSLPDGIPKPVFDVISNCRVESVLTNARALTDFLDAKPRNRRYLHHSHFKPWRHDVMEQTGRIFGVVSTHLSHPVLGDDEDETHPGAWPLTELAVTLVGGLADFLTTDPETTPTFDAAWFDPNPLPVYDELRGSLERLTATEISTHVQVAKLTTTLQIYLEKQGVLVHTAAVAVSE